MSTCDVCGRLENIVAITEFTVTTGDKSRVKVYLCTEHDTITSLVNAAARDQAGQRKRTTADQLFVEDPSTLQRRET